MDALNDAVNLREVRIPELWAVSDMLVLEVLVQPGERVARNTPLLVLEPGKATLDAPARSGPVEPWDPPGELRMKAPRVMTTVTARRSAGPDPEMHAGGGSCRWPGGRDSGYCEPLCRRSV